MAPIALKTIRNIAIPQSLFLTLSQEAEKQRCSHREIVIRLLNSYTEHRILSFFANIRHWTEVYQKSENIQREYWKQCYFRVIVPYCTRRFIDPYAFIKEDIEKHIENIFNFLSSKKYLEANTAACRLFQIFENLQSTIKFKSTIIQCESQIIVNEKDEKAIHYLSPLQVSEEIYTFIVNYGSHRIKSLVQILQECLFWSTERRMKKFLNIFTDSIYIWCRVANIPENLYFGLKDYLEDRENRFRNILVDYQKELAYKIIKNIKEGNYFEAKRFAEQALIVGI